MNARQFRAVVIAAAVVAALASAFGAGVAGPAHAQGRNEAEDDEAEPQRIASKVVTHGEVCPDPRQPCADVETFHTNELSFRLHSKFKGDRGQDRSRPFYAVILKSAALCGIADAERVAAQAVFPDRKVFVHQLHCNGFSDKATYTNVNGKAGFIGVYAGRTEAEARAFLDEVKAAGRYPDANLRRMQVVLVYQLE